MKSLKDQLYDRLLVKGYLSYGEVAQIAVEEGYKVSTAERRLRKSESPYVEPEKKISRRGSQYTAGYKWQPPKETKEEIKASPLKVEPSLF